MQYDLDKLFIATIKPHQGEQAFRWHVGGDMKGIENVSTIVHSDTLFSALCHAWVKLFGKSELDKVIKHRFLKGDPPFRISSVFLADLSKSPSRYFVPKPRLPIPLPAQECVFLKHAKELERADFIDLDCLIKWLNLKREKERGEELDSDKCEELYKAIIKASQEYQDVFWTGVEIGIETDRIAATSPELFYRGNSMMEEEEVRDYTYYFLAYCHDDRYIELLNVLINEVSRSGLGGERSIGFGRFATEDLQEVSDEWRKLFEWEAHSTNYLLLSLCSPTEQEIAVIDRSHARYSLVPRKGWFDSPTGYTFKRKRCNLFGEGSFLPLNGQQLHGQLVDVSPTIWEETLKPQLGDAWHPIYRYGVALGIPI